MARKMPYIPPELRQTPKQERAPLFTVEDLAERWQTSKANIYRMMQDGRLKSVKLGPGTVRFRPTDIAALEEPR